MPAGAGGVGSGRGTDTGVTGGNTRSGMTGGNIGPTATGTGSGAAGGAAARVDTPDETTKDKVGVCPLWIASLNWEDGDGCLCMSCGPAYYFQALSHSEAG